MNFKNIKYIFIIFVVLILIFAVYKMNSKNDVKLNVETENAQSVVYQDNLRLGISNLDTINPLKTTNKEMININQLIYEPLITLKSDYRLELALATEYAKTAEKTYIVKINTDIKWSNGTKLTSKDVKYTVNLLKSVDNIYSQNVKEISDVETIDESTVKITLNKDVPFFEYNLIFPIMCENYYEKDNFFNTDKYPIGTGLYKISSVSDNLIILEKNENYRNPDKTNKNVQKININVYKEIGEVYNSFKIGNIDLINTSSLLYEDYIGTMGYYKKEYKGREFDFLSCNYNDPIMKEKSVRQAINLAIDKSNIVSTVYNNYYVTSDYVLDYGNYLYSNSNLSSGYNPEKAKEVLANDGWVYSNNRWRKNNRTLSFTISVKSSDEKRCQVADIIKTQLADIGIVVNISKISDWQYNDFLKNKKYQVLFTGIYNGYSPDLSYFYGKDNISNYNNDEIFQLLDDVKNITDSKVLQEKFQTLVELTKGEYLYIGLYRNKCNLLVNQKVIGNMEPNNYGVFYNFESWNRE